MNRKIVKKYSTKRPLHIIANDIDVNWYRPNDKAQKMIEAMKHIDRLGDDYKGDSGYYIVGTFMANCKDWRTGRASYIKEELMYYED
jgi:hypothetical protein